MTKTKRPSSERLTPAQVVVKTFDGVRATARLLGLAPGTVSRWQTMRAGRIPGKHHIALLEAAKAQRKKLTTDDLIYGRAVSACR